MLRRFTLIILFIALVINLKAQAFEQFKARTELIKLSEFDYFFHREQGFTFLSQLRASKAIDFEEALTDRSHYLRVQLPSYERYWTIAGYQQELRINLVEYYNTLSFSVNTPFRIDLNSHRRNKMIRLGISAGVIGQFNFFLGSTIEDLDPIGFRLGAGYITNYAINLEYHQPISVYPIMRFGIVFPAAKRNCAIDFTSSFSATKIITMGADEKHMETNLTNYFLSIRFSTFITKDS